MATADHKGRTVDVDLRGLSGFRAMIAEAKAKGGDAANVIGDMERQWGRRLLTYWERRYRRASRGGGVWPDLAESTKRRRRGARAGASGARVFAVLVDTGTTAKALTPGAFGNLFESVPGGVRVGFDSDTHPGVEDGDPLTVGELAAIHHFGLGVVPERPILVEPPATVLAAMASDGARAMQKLELLP